MGDVVIPEIEKERDALIKLYKDNFASIVKPVEDSIRSFEASIPVATYSIRTDIRG